MAKKKGKKQPSPSVTPPIGPTRPALQPAWWLYLLLFGISVLVYLNTLGHSYTQDDAIVITDNQFTQQGLAGLPGIFGKDTFFGFFKVEGKAKLVSGGRYRPLSLATFALEWELFGKSPGISHLLNALLYGGCTVMFFLFLLLAGGMRSPLSAQTLWWSTAAALLFAVHPIHTEAVANIKGRDEILALLGSLGALYAVLRGIRDNRFGWHLLGAGLLLLGLLAKENAITLLGIIPLSFYFFTDLSWRKWWKPLLPYAMGSLIFLVIRGGILGWALGEPVLELMNNPFLKWTGTQYVPFSPGEKSATIMYTLGKYLQLLFVPFPLTHDYYPRHVGIMTWGDWRVLLSFFVYLGILFMGIQGLRQRRIWSFGIWWYLFTLFLVSNILFPIGTNMAERLLFMPSIGWCIAVAYLLGTLRQRSLANGMVTGVVVVFALLTWLRNPVWKDNFTLFTTDVRTSVNSAKLQNATGGELLTASLALTNADSARAWRLRAEQHLQRAIAIHPTYKNAYLLLGNCYNYLQQYDQSIQAYQQALRLDPDYVDARQNLAITWRDAGRFAGEQQNNPGLALQYLKQAEPYLPTDYETMRLLAIAYAYQNDTGKAIDYFTRAANIRPELADAWFNLGTAYFQQGDAVAGQQYYDKAIAIDPKVAERMR